MIGMKTINQSYCAFKQHGLDACSIQDADGGCKPVAELRVALRIGGVDPLEKCAQFLI
jgi:hypothetical protein